jgi:hypothetical protein
VLAAVGAVVAVVVSPFWVGFGVVYLGGVVAWTTRAVGGGLERLREAGAYEPLPVGRQAALVRKVSFWLLVVAVLGAAVVMIDVESRGEVALWDLVLVAGLVVAGLVYRRRAAVLSPPTFRPSPRWGDRPPLAVLPVLERGRPAPPPLCSNSCRPPPQHERERTLGFSPLPQRHQPLRYLPPSRGIIPVTPFHRDPQRIPALWAGNHLPRMSGRGHVGINHLRRPRRLTRRYLLRGGGPTSRYASRGSQVPSS